MEVSNNFTFSFCLSLVQYVHLLIQVFFFILFGNIYNGQTSPEVSASNTTQGRKSTSIWDEASMSLPQPGIPVHSLISSLLLFCFCELSNILPLTLCGPFYLYLFGTESILLTNSCHPPGQMEPISNCPPYPQSGINSS